MPFLGTIVNAAAVVAGSAVGLVLGARLSEKTQASVLHALGLATVFIGLSMAFGESRAHPLVIIGSLAFGSVIGEYIGIEGRLRRVGERLKERAARHDPGGFATGFVAASLLFCVGPMTVLGAIQDGLSGEHSLLFAKSVLDGFASIALAAGLGVGVAFAALTVIVYQGLLTLVGLLLAGQLDPGLFAGFTAAGGLLVVGIGANLLGATRLRVGNMLPALVVAVCADAAILLLSR